MSEKDKNRKCRKRKLLLKLFGLGWNQFLTLSVSDTRSCFPRLESRDSGQIDTCMNVGWVNNNSNNNYDNDNSNSNNAKKTSNNGSKKQGYHLSYQCLKIPPGYQTNEEKTRKEWGRLQLDVLVYSSHRLLMRKKSRAAACPLSSLSYPTVKVVAKPGGARACRLGTVWPVADPHFNCGYTVLYTVVYRYVLLNCTPTRTIPPSSASRATVPLIVTY